MKIPIKRFEHFVPGKGRLLVSAVNVTVAQFELGGKIRANYELLQVPNVAEGTKPAPRDVVVANGRAELTDEQAKQWVAADAAYFCECIVRNAGLEPA